MGLHHLPLFVEGFAVLLRKGHPILASRDQASHIDPSTGDPTADPTQAWPEDRQKIEAGTLVVSQIDAEADGACRDINFDPTVLPPGMRTSDDPFPAARSAAYAVSYDRRTAEAKSYPQAHAGAKP